MKRLLRITIPVLILVLSGCAHHRGYSSYSAGVDYSVGYSQRSTYPVYYDRYYPAYYDRHVYVETPIIVETPVIRHYDNYYEKPVHKYNKHEKSYKDKHYSRNNNRNYSEKFAYRSRNNRSQSYSGNKFSKRGPSSHSDKRYRR